MDVKRVRALSFWWPWGSLIVHGHKKIETRGHRKRYRGDLVIHEAKRFKSVEAEYLFRHPVYRPLLLEMGFKPYERPATLGCVLGKVTLVDCVRSEVFRPELSELEAELGDFRDGRYGWLLRDPVRFAQPIEQRGAQGLWWWNVLPEVAEHFPDGKPLGV